MHVPPFCTLGPSEQLEIATLAIPLGAVHGLGTQENVDGAKNGGVVGTHLILERLGV